MGVVYNLMRNTAKAIPVLLAKIGTFFLFIFTVGMAIGYYFATTGYSYLILLVPVASMFVMWHKLDEGVLVFIILLALVVFYPQIFAG